MSISLGVKEPAHGRFPQDRPDELVRMQKQHWDPLFAWLDKTYGVKLQIQEGLLPAKQSTDVEAKLREVVEGMDIWELAGELTRCGVRAWA